MESKTLSDCRKDYNKVPPILQSSLEAKTVNDCTKVDKDEYI